MKVLLINPPIDNMVTSTVPDFINSQMHTNPVPPLGLLYIASYAEEHGYEVEVLDMVAQKISIGCLFDKIVNSKPNVVGITTTTLTLFDALSVARAVKEVDPKIITVLGGAHTYIYSQETLAFPEVDRIVIGEGELPFVKLLKDIWNYKPEVEIVEDIDSLPFPARHLVDNSLYCSTLGKGKMMTGMVTSRGCPYNCIAENEKVTMARGNTKPIQDIKIGEKVLSVDWEGNAKEGKVVASIRTATSCDIIELDVGNSKLRCTQDHLILTNRGWVKAGKLKIGDYVAKYKTQIKKRRDTIYDGEIQIYERWYSSEVVLRRMEVSRGQEVFFRNRDSRFKGKITEEQSYETGICKAEESGVATCQQGSYRGKASTYEVEQSYGKSRNTCESEQYSKNKIWACNIRKSENAMGKRGYVPQSHVGGSKAVAKYTYEEKQSDEESGSCYEASYCNEMEIFSRPNEASSSLEEWRWCKQHRGRVGKNIRTIRFQLYRGWEVLDRTVSQRKKQKSRFCIQDRKDEDSPFIQFPILALVERKRQGGIRRLPEIWMETVCCRREDAGEYGYFNRKNKDMVKFYPVTKIKSVDKSTVYDIETIPYHNFIVSGIVVHNCSFCHQPHYGKKWRARSVGNVVAEIEECIKLGISEIEIYDDTFTYDRQRVIDICLDIIRKNLKVDWAIRTRVDRVDKEMLQIMAKAGCRRINYGIESANPEVLKMLRKGITPEQSIEAVRMTKEVGIEVQAYFMIGSPRETKKQILNTIDFANKLNPDYCYYSITSPTPATLLYTLGMKEGKFNDYWGDFAKNPVANFKARFCGDLQRDELIRLMEQGYRSFYLKPKFILKQLTKVRSFSDLVNKAKIMLGMR